MPNAECRVPNGGSLESRALGSLLVAGALLLAVLPAATQAAADIPETALAPLQAELTALKTSRASSSSKRRACKSVIRDAQALVRAQPDAPNRFPALQNVRETKPP